MITKAKIALAAVIVSAFAFPAFAQLGVGAEPVTDGRFLPTVYSANNNSMAQSWTARRGSWRSIDAAEIDRQAQGHN